MSITGEEGRNRLLQECLTNLKGCAALIGEYLSEDERDDQINIIEQVARDYHEQNMKHKISKVAIKLTEEYFERENVVTTDIDEKYNENIKNSVAHVIQFEEDPNMREIIDALHNAKDIAETSQNPNESIVLTQVSQMPVDPITKTQIKDPCKNKVCGHVYEYNVIVSYIKSKKVKYLNCPYVGCANKNIQIADLIKDNQMALGIRNNQATGALETSVQEID